MKKTMLLFAAITGTVALGVAQAQQNVTPASLDVVGKTDHSIILKLTANVLTPPVNGFVLQWYHAPGDRHSIEFPCVVLNPGDSFVFEVDGVTGSDCMINNQPEALQCGTQYKFLGRTLPSGLRTTSTGDFTSDCE